jgi:DNA-binding NtrC family response regulator
MNNSILKVLLIDRDPQRKERISALKNNGYRVFPALDLKQARERCKPGAYDLIIVNVGEQPEMALEFCESIKSRDPKQSVLLMTDPSVQLPPQDYMVPDIPERLLERVKWMFERANIVAKAA